jgi:hypothetical protein
VTQQHWAAGRMPTAVIAWPGRVVMVPSPGGWMAALIDGVCINAVRKGFQMLPERRKFFSEQQRNLFEQGAEQGKALGRIEGRAEGRVEGWIEGRAEGRVEGLLEGMLEAKADMLLRLIKQREWSITEAQRRRIVDCAEMAVLNRWLDRMLPAISVDNLLT